MSESSEPLAGPVAQSPGAPWSVMARADRAAAPLGEPFPVEVILRHAAEDRFTVAADQALQPFALRSAGCATHADGGQAFTRCTLTLARIDLGEASPPIALVGIGPSGRVSFTVSAPAVRAALVSDATRPAREIELAGLASPVPLLVPTWRPLGWAGGGLAVAIALAVVARRAFGRRRVRSSPAPTVAPEEALLAAVSALEAEELCPRGRGRELFFRLAAAVRGYVAARTGLPAEALATAELLDGIDAQPAPALAREPLADLLAMAEPICFAGVAPSADECARALALARQLARGAS